MSNPEYWMKRAFAAEKLLETSEMDAERYRWLRDDAPVNEISINEMIFVDPARTDEAFDAAMKEPKR